MPRTAAGVAAVLALALAAGPAGADVKKKDVAAAIATAAAVALGVAALSHDSVDYSPGRPMVTGQQKAEFEQGYRDGLAGAPYRTRLPAATYGEGYNAGVRERNLQQKGSAGPKLAKVPKPALKGCIDKAAKKWNISRKNVNATDARKGAADTWLIEVVAGKRTGLCNMTASGAEKGAFVNGASL